MPGQDGGHLCHLTRRNASMPTRAQGAGRRLPPGPGRMRAAPPDGDGGARGRRLCAAALVLVLGLGTFLAWARHRDAGGSRPQPGWIDYRLVLQPSATLVQPKHHPSATLVPP